MTSLKSNRLVSPEKGKGNVHLDPIVWTDEQLASGILVHLKAVPFLVLLFKIVAKNGDVEWIITNRETLKG